MKATIAIHRTDGYSYTVDDGLLQTVTVVRQSDGRTWKGATAEIDDAVFLAGRIIDEQKALDNPEPEQEATPQ